MSNYQERWRGTATNSRDFAANVKDTALRLVEREPENAFIYSAGGDAESTTDEGSRGRRRGSPGPVRSATGAELCRCRGYALVRVLDLPGRPEDPSFCRPGSRRRYAEILAGVPDHGGPQSQPVTPPIRP